MAKVHLYIHKASTSKYISGYLWLLCIHSEQSCHCAHSTVSLIYHHYASCSCSWPFCNVSMWWKKWAYALFQFNLTSIAFTFQLLSFQILYLGMEIFSVIFYLIWSHHSQKRILFFSILVISNLAHFHDMIAAWYILIEDIAYISFCLTTLVWH